MSERLTITASLSIALSEVQMSAMRAQGAGGQNVNKVSSAIHLRFDIKGSTLPWYIKTKLLNSKDSRITQDGILVIKAQQHRTQELNKRNALERLSGIIQKASHLAPIRRATKPTRASQKRRVETKKRRGMNKSLRAKVTID